jgi:beta-glucanase (GH16 family)
MAKARHGAGGGRAARALALVGAAALACGLEPAPQQQSGGNANTNPNPNPNPNPTPSALPPAGYRLVWSDEFEGTGLSAGKWTALSGPRRDGVMTPGSVSVANGLLTMTTYTDAARVHHTGFVTTEGLFAARFGYFEARIRFHDAPGAWCAFWISAHSVDFGGDPAVNGDEIDVVEHRVTDPGGWNELADMVALNVNWNGYGPDKRTAQLVTALPDKSKVQGEWHTYSVLWTANAYVYYVDGVELWRPQAPISQIAQDLRLTCEVEDGAWAGYVPAGGYGSPSTSTTKMDVDWVRVWQPQ